MKFYLLIIFWIFSFTANSQVVNIEKKRVKGEGDGWQGTVSTSLNYTKNTNEIIQGSNSLKLQHYKDKNSYLIFNDISIMQINDEKYLNSGFLHFRYNHDFNKKVVIAEAFTQIQYNELQKLQRRFLWGGGLRYKLMDKEKLRLFMGTLAMYEFELLDNDETTDIIRMNCYLSVGYKYNDSFSFNNITYYQPNIAAFDDYRIASETSMNIKINKKLTFRTFFKLNYDSAPPTVKYDDGRPDEVVPSIFYSLNNGISYKF